MSEQAGLLPSHIEAFIEDLKRVMAEDAQEAADRDAIAAGTLEEAPEPEAGF